MNLKRCESCSRVFRGDIKIVHINKQSARSSSAAASSVSRSEGSRDPQAVESVPRENLGKVAAVSRVGDGAPRDSSVPSVGEGGPGGLKGRLLTAGISQRKVKGKGTGQKLMCFFFYSAAIEEHRIVRVDGVRMEECGE